MSVSYVDIPIKVAIRWCCPTSAKSVVSCSVLTQQDIIMNWYLWRGGERV